MKLTTQSALRLIDALKHFDVPPASVDGKAAREPYKLAGSARMAIALNLARLLEVAEAYQKARNGLVYDHGNGGTMVADARLAEFEKAHAALLEGQCEVNLVCLSTADLQLDDNPLPVTVIAGLMPIIDLTLKTVARDAAA